MPSYNPAEFGGSLVQPRVQTSDVRPRDIEDKIDGIRNYGACKYASRSGRKLIRDRRYWERFQQALIRSTPSIFREYD